MTPVAFALQRWAVWAAPESADVGFLPAMQRRRLGPLAKAVFHTAHRCLEEGEQIPLVCSSVHGESQRTFGILEDLAAGEPVSPAAFSLSVHNAIAGQLSIAFGNRAPALALAPGSQGAAAALLEACGWLQEWPAVLVLLYDEPPPAFYRPFVENPPVVPTAIALRLSAATADNRHRLQPLPPQPAERAATLADLAGFLAGDAPELLLAAQPGGWRWSRARD